MTTTTTPTNRHRGGPARVVRDNSIDPHAHVGLARLAALKLARAVGGSSDEHLGRAYLGLVDAARTYDPSTGFRFSTHATSAIRFRAYKDYRQEKGYRKGNGGRTWEPTPSSATAPLHDGMTGPTPDPAPDSRGTLEEVIRFAGHIPHAAAVLRMRARGMTPKQVGLVLGLTRQRVQQIVAAVSEHVQARWTGPVPGRWPTEAVA